MSPRKPPKPGETVTLKIDGVDPAVRHGFKEACNFHGRDMGETISQLMKKWVMEMSNAPPLEEDPKLRNNAHAWMEGYRRWQVQEHEEIEADQPDQGPSSGPV